MKILHIWNTAGVAGNVSEYLHEHHGIESDVLIRGSRDKFNLATDRCIDIEKEIIKGSMNFYLYCFNYAKDYDIIHFHSIDKWLQVFHYLFPNKPLVIHYHGTEIRNRWKDRKKYWKYADDILVSTPDLIKDIDAPLGALYVPNMVNVKLCDKFKDNKKYGTAFHNHYDANDLAVDMAYGRGLNINIHRRETLHEEFLDMLSRYRYYIDVKRKNGQVLEAYSLTGLEALYMGVKVINYKNKLRSRLPKEFRPSNIAQIYLQIYGELYNG